VRCDEGAVVGGRLKARGRRRRLRCPEAVREPIGGLVEFVIVGRRPAGLGWRGDEAQRRRSLELLGAEDAAVERPEADAAAAELEALGERPYWDQVVVAPLQLADMLKRGLAQLDVPRIPHAR
jgi:hypothetical protein